MIRRSRDAKFVIYQVLYIFVITVLALKGAEINLGEVVDKESVVQKSVRDSLLNIVDSLSALGLKFNIEVDKNVVEENKILKEKLTELNTQVASLAKTTKPKLSQIQEVKEMITQNIPSPFSSKRNFLQYATNSAENKGNFIVEIIDPNSNVILVEIKPNENANFELGEQSEVKLRYANVEENITVKKNLPPEIKIEKVTSKMEKHDIYVKELQRTTCFNVIISDERIEQIKINYSGPIEVSKPNKNSKGEVVYTVSLNLVNNENRFEEWADRNEHLKDSDGRYKANFFFTAFDTKSKQKVEVGESFFFTDYSK
jgi:hypothetical protein